MPERIYVDPDGYEMAWCYEAFEEFTGYIRADKYAELEEQNKRLVELLDKAQWLLCDIANDGNNLDGSTFMYSGLLGDDEWMIMSNEWCSEKVAALASMEKDDE